MTHLVSHIRGLGEAGPKVFNFKVIVYLDLLLVLFCFKLGMALCPRIVSNTPRQFSLRLKVRVLQHGLVSYLVIFTSLI